MKNVTEKYSKTEEHSVQVRFGGSTKSFEEIVKGKSLVQKSGQEGVVCELELAQRGRGGWVFQGYGWLTNYPKTCIKQLFIIFTTSVGQKFEQRLLVSALECLGPQLGSFKSWE